MISIQENGKTFSIVNSREKWIEINGVRYPFPRYEFIDGKFKRTWKALYHLFF